MHSESTIPNSGSSRVASSTGRNIAAILGGLFLLLNMLDLLLTWRLLAGGRNEVYEANPLAAHILEAHGWPGLTSFKLGMSFLALAILFSLHSVRPHTCRVVLAAACLLLTGVTAYSGWLLAESRSPEAEKQMANHQWNDDPRMQQRLKEMKRYSVLLAELADDLRAERRSLADATLALRQELARMEEFDPLRVDKGFRIELGRDGCLSAILARQVGFEVCETPDAEDLHCRLSAEFERLYDAGLPRFVKAAFFTADPRLIYDEKPASALPTSGVCNAPPPSHRP